MKQAVFTSLSLLSGISLKQFLTKVFVFSRVMKKQGWDYQ